jgi:23S rRNA pseudouridine1911/1915/1917 synthase
MPPDEIILRYVVPSSYAGLRVDVFLKSRLKKMSRTRVKEVIESGNCYFESRKEMSPAARVEANDIVCVRREVRDDEAQVPTHYGVIHEDGRLLVVDKPAGLPVHPTSRYMKGNLVSLLRRDFGGATLRLCHRIDRETSGILLVAKDLEGERFIKRQFATRGVRKSYMALVWGRLEPEAGVIDAPLRSTRGSRIRTKMEVADGEHFLHAGKPAVTRYRVAGRSRRFTLVECFPETGRQHQIRIHLAHLGHPIVGDKIYSVEERVFVDFCRQGFTPAVASRLVLPRHALHAHTLSFLHPDGGRRVEFSAPLAEDIRRVVDGDLEE